MTLGMAFVLSSREQHFSKGLLGRFPCATQLFALLRKQQEALTETQSASSVPQDRKICTA